MNKIATRILSTLGLIFLICILMAAVDGTYSMRAILFGTTEAKLFNVMEQLDTCDRVELYRIGQTTNDIGNGTFPIPAHRRHYCIQSVKVLEQEQAEEIIYLWNHLTFDIRLSALCHEPAFGYRFYRRNELVFETSVCWMCKNFTITTLKFIHGYWGFDANSKAGKALYQLSEELLPTVKTDG
jgi:hypothetical protein